MASSRRTSSRPARADRPALDRPTIVAGARVLVAEGGLGSLSARSLAARLGVTPMALYRHVADMDEIVAAVVDELLAAESMPSSRRTGWQRWLEQLALTLRHLFHAEPSALGLFTRRPVTTPEARRRLQATVETLGRHGFDEQAAVEAYAAVHTYTIGFCALEVARRTSEPAATRPEDDVTATHIRGFVTEAQFHHGLRALVAGLAPAGATRG